MQSRNDRHKKIQELIAKQRIETQSQLQSALSKSGFEVNQATLSRDMRELGLVKVAAGGRYSYANPETVSTTTMAHRSLASVKRFVRDVDYSGNTIVIKTDSGAAAHVAEAIDHSESSGVLGTVAGDNTILLIVRRRAEAREVVKQLKAQLG